MSQPENAKPKGAKNTKSMLVSYGRLGLMGWFEHNEPTIPKLNSHVIIKTERGLELGRVVGVHNYRAGQFRNTPEQVESYFGNLGPNSPVGPGGEFVRFATHEDLREQEHLVQSEQEEIACCEKYIKEFKLPMRVVDAEHLFGGERIVYYFSSDGRVDFRELVKTLAREYQTRIELRQIGARDEAKLISDFETCGQQCCCSRFLKILEPVNMRMAKLQKATLDPSKISGHCGRLKCCLRYEDKTYMDLKDRLPHRNSTVRTPKGTGRVVDVQILTQLVVVQDALGDRQAWPVDELLPMDEAAAAEEMKKRESTRPLHPLNDSMDIIDELEDEARLDQDETAPAVQQPTDKNQQQPAPGRGKGSKRPQQNRRPSKQKADPSPDARQKQQPRKNRRKKRRNAKRRDDSGRSDKNNNA